MNESLSSRINNLIRVFRSQNDENLARVMDVVDDLLAYVKSIDDNHARRENDSNTLLACPKCGAAGVAFVCFEQGCSVNGGPAVG